MDDIEELTGCYRLVKGNAFARAGLEIGSLGIGFARSQEKPLHELLGGTRTEILSGVSLGIQPDVEVLLGRIDQFLDEGYRRIKLKIDARSRAWTWSGGFASAIPRSRCSLCPTQLTPWSTSPRSSSSMPSIYC